MKVAVIAANGRTGKEFVNEALKAGHAVNAGVYGSHDFQAAENLRVINCDATNLNQLKNLAVGCDVIVSFIGHGKKSPADVQTEAIKSAVTAAKELAIKRIISLTGTGVRFPGDHITIMDRLLNLSISVIDPKRVRDGIMHADVLKNSNLDWTIIRVLKLTNSEPKKFTLNASGPTKVFTSRKEVAQAALQIIEDSSFPKQAPIICK